MQALWEATMTTMTLGRRRFLGMAAGSITLAGAARAEPYDLIDLTVVDRETGQTLQVWRRNGRMYVAGRPGARYSVRVTNNTGERVLAVMSVDGVNVLTGETAGFAQRGYVFEPYQSYDVSGWRKSGSEVAAFTFAAQRNSYAARTGRPFDVGVIGVAVFKERAYYRPPPPAAVAAPSSRDSADNEVSESVVTGARRGAAAPPPALQRREERLGTGHGEREWSPATEVAFERATRYPQAIRRIEYDTYDNLVAAGVIPRPPYPDRQPRPFPSEGYVPDPPGWR
jgi:hypothetical protein